ncbi:ASCH domain-containing protein [Pelomonas sp. SE-A7]|uniref:ASCH domain-containing protein n=1 Tax=Pelomonas sp. SE-A7 TaxID=3054953 RepID=UPI00259D2E0F|nr:ASCH domain-containing protein [Pelomonas sp. SE-A7]MDM4766570.1 ASCH domain-containing protein [Pelomonas sp. SE-A7]
MTTPIPAPLADFWSAFADSIAGVDPTRFYEVCVFGDSEALANELAELVLLGTKRATSGSVWSYEDEGKRIPIPGDLSIVTNWAGRPLCIIETESVEVVPFSEVSSEFAATEGEGDGSLSFWREAHRQYFTRECARSGRQFSENMLVACERFRVAYVVRS